MLDATESFFRYLQYEKRVSRHTLTSYQNDLQQLQTFLAETFGQENVALADYGSIRAWIIHLMESGLQPPSINRKIATLRTFYKFLLREQTIVKNPMQKIRILKAAKRLPAFVRENEMKELLDNTAFTNDFCGLRDRLVMEMLYATGMRLSELITVKESDVDLHGCTVKVLGKRSKERVIPFPKSLVTVIRAYLAERNKTIDVHRHGVLLVTETGEPCYPMLIYRIVRHYLDQSTTAHKRSPHVLRHTYATHLLNNGAEINAVKDLLGHSSLAATQVYTHNSIEKLKKAYDQAHPKA